jgi:hypothetical protein
MLSSHIVVLSPIPTSHHTLVVLQTAGSRYFKPRRPHSVRTSTPLFFISNVVRTSWIREFGGDFLDSSVVANLAGL